MKRPQHIREVCSSEEFTAIEAGEKVFQIRVANLNLIPGDMLTFEEIDTDNKKTGKSVTRKIIDVQNTRDIKCTPDECEVYGYTVLGLTGQDINTLRSVFSKYFTMGFVLEKRSDEDWNLLSDPVYLPLLICPELAIDDIFKRIRVDKWPVGVYSVHLRLQPQYNEESELFELEIDNSFILVMVETQNSEEPLIGVEIDLFGLTTGTCVSIKDEPVTPTPPEDVANYYEPAIDDDDEAMFGIFDPDLTDKQLAKIIEREGKEHDE